MDDSSGGGTPAWSMLAGDVDSGQARPTDHVDDIAPGDAARQIVFIDGKVPDAQALAARRAAPASRS